MSDIFTFKPGDTLVRRGCSIHFLSERTLPISVLEDNGIVVHADGGGTAVGFDRNAQFAFAGGPRHDSASGLLRWSGEILP